MVPSVMVIARKDEVDDDSSGPDLMLIVREGSVGDAG